MLRLHVYLLHLLFLANKSAKWRGFLTTEQREQMKLATVSADTLSSSPKSSSSLLSETYTKFIGGGKGGNSGVPARHVRRTHSGKLVRVKKDGAGGKGTWGKLLDTDGEAHIDRNDPNYDSGEDGKIEAEVKLTGILSLGALQPGEFRKYGTTIAPGLYAPVHQHFFVDHMNVAVDCKPLKAFNQVVELNVKVEEPGENNVHSSAFYVEEELLTSELQAMRDCNPLSARRWIGSPPP